MRQPSSLRGSTGELLCSFFFEVFCGMRAFVTVGSTQFDELIMAVDDEGVQKALRGIGVNELTVQYGRGRYRMTTGRGNVLNVEAYDFKPSLHDDMIAADLIISHAGAGTMLESLRLGKRLIVVVNESLMENHQAELAEEMERSNHSYAATVSTLLDVIKRAVGI
mmetsp:Transcript_16906/g.69026  ORF Transcript_16906/g.69026 Transcript_16906/m.69026 type:complete len:165 (-) Transcript_16906:2336-2830(-)